MGILSRKGGTGKNLVMICGNIKGSPDSSRFIFEINVGKSRIASQGALK